MTTMSINGVRSTAYGQRRSCLCGLLLLGLQCFGVYGATTPSTEQSGTVTNGAGSEAAPPPQPFEHWTTMHHDVRNTGRANFVGPAEAPRTCSKRIARVGSELYLNTGSVSLNNSELYTGTNGPTVEVWNVETLKQSTILLPDSGQILGSPTIWGEPNKNGTFGEELALVGTTEGWIYVLRTAECHHGSKPEGSCLKWKKRIDPIVAPIRVTRVPGRKNGVAIVSSSDAIGEDRGRVWAFDVRTGDSVWDHPFNTTYQIDTGNTSVTKWYGMHYIPAIGKCLEEPVAFFGYGPVLRGLSITTGEEIVEPYALSDITGGNITEVVKSSVALSETTDCEMSITFQTEKTSRDGSALWSLKILPDASDSQNIGLFTPAWRCEYVHEKGDKNSPLRSRCSQFGKLHTKPTPVDFDRIAEDNDVDTRSLIESEVFAPIPTGSGLKLGTPAILMDETEVEDKFVFTQYDYLPDDPAGAVCVWKSNGSVVWDVQRGLDGKKFGSSLSSPALDSAGNMYVASDAVNEDLERIPVLFAINVKGEVQWTIQLGKSGDTVGFISPIVAEGPEHEKRVYVATVDDHMVISEGCPSNTTEECSGHGTCQCENAKPVCECDVCHVGKDCAEFNLCGGFGNCRLDKGGCVCEEGFKRDGPRNCVACGFCEVGPNCSQPLSCNDRGVCVEKEETCYCETGFYGRFCQHVYPSPGACPTVEPAPSCSAPSKPSCTSCPTCTSRPSSPTPSCPACSPSAGGANARSNSGTPPGDVVAGVAIPLLVIGFCVAICVCHRQGCFTGSRFGSRLDSAGESVGEKLNSMRSHRSAPPVSTSTSGFATSSSSYGTGGSTGGTKKGAYSVL
eukprot:gb/GECG01013724.1/.p1 GENE.gb/GECG01013724.1/~~gb/GECG01013724.1/.p1  ORF type:complete len:846 (+),score=60.28 gb/GECG01013724.1/:1-2538(+)